MVVVRANVRVHVSSVARAKFKHQRVNNLSIRLFDCKRKNYLITNNLNWVFFPPPPPWIRETSYYVRFRFILCNMNFLRCNTTKLGYDKIINQCFENYVNIITNYYSFWVTTLHYLGHKYNYILIINYVINIINYISKST